MTFFGFDEKAVDAERQKLYDSFRKAEEFDKLPPEERAKHFLLRRRFLPGWVSPNPPRRNDRKHIGRCAGRC